MRRSFNIVAHGVLLAALLVFTAASGQDLTTAAAARDRAAQADAATLAADEWEDAEKSLAKANRLAEKSSNAEKISAAFAAASDAFAEAELEAIKVKLLDPARRALRAAEDQRAKRYAPQTYARAIEQLDAAETAIITDRYATDRISQLAERARLTANHAVRIANVVAGKPETENLLLERDAYLARIAAAAGIQPAADADAAAVAAELESGVAALYASEQRLQQDLADSRAFAAALEEEIRALDAQLGGATAERRALVIEIEKQARAEEKFLQTETLFTELEADVFRQSDTIVIRLFGLEFESGSAELGENNGPLLEKVGTAVSLYPGAIVLVEGHTDSQGGSRLNQRLSQNRADSVAGYMIDNLRVAPNLIEAIGYGTSRPIANNETKEGRAKNRRIDLIIKPAG